MSEPYQRARRRQRCPPPHTPHQARRIPSSTSVGWAWPVGRRRGNRRSCHEAWPGGCVCSLPASHAVLGEARGPPPGGPTPEPQRCSEPQATESQPHREGHLLCCCVGGPFKNKPPPPHSPTTLVAGDPLGAGPLGPRERGELSAFPYHSFPGRPSGARREESHIHMAFAGGRGISRKAAGAGPLPNHPPVGDTAHNKDRGPFSTFTPQIRGMITQIIGRRLLSLPCCSLRPLNVTGRADTQRQGVLNAGIGRDLPSSGCLLCCAHTTGVLLRKALSSPQSFEKGSNSGMASPSAGLGLGRHHSISPPGSVLRGNHGAVTPAAREGPQGPQGTKTHHNPRRGVFAGISRSLHGPLSLSHWDLDPDRTEQNTGVVQQGRMRRLRSMARCLRQLGKNYARLPRTLCQPRYPHGGHSSLSPPLPERPQGYSAPGNRVA